MDDNIISVREGLLSPSKIALYTLLGLSIPALLNYFLTGKIMQGYYGGPLIHGFSTITIQLFVSFVIYLIFYNVKPFKLRLGIYIESKNLIIFFILFYLGIGLYVYSVLWSTIRPLEIASTQIGVVLAEEGLGFYYNFLYAPLIALFVIKYYGKSAWLLRIADLGVLVFIIGVYFINRRELMLVALILWIVSFNKFRITNIKKKYLIIAFVIFITITYFSFLARGVNFDDGFITSYLSTEEFLPVQFSMYLIDKWISNPYINDLTRLSPTTWFLGNASLTEINAYELSKNFSYSRYGPTVTFISTIVLYGFVTPLMILYLFAKTTVTIYNKSINKEMAWAKIMYPFLVIKTLIFIRNGEVTVFLIDPFFFFMFLLPFIIFRSTKEKEVAAQK